MTANTDDPTTGQISEAERDLAPMPPDPDDVSAPERPSVSSYLFAADAGAPRRRRAPDVWRFFVAGD